MSTVTIAKIPEAALNAVQRSAVATYLQGAFPNVLVGKFTQLVVSRTAGDVSIRAYARELGSITATQFANMRKQGQRISLIAYDGETVTASRRQNSDGRVPQQAEPDDPQGTYEALRTMVTEVFGLTGGDLQNMHHVVINRPDPDGAPNTATGFCQYLVNVSDHEWCVGIAAGSYSDTPYPHPYEE